VDKPNDAVWRAPGVPDWARALSGLGIIGTGNRIRSFWRIVLMSFVKGPPFSLSIGNEYVSVPWFLCRLVTVCLIHPELCSFLR
jgi:hypothetical protein